MEAIKLNKLKSGEAAEIIDIQAEPALYQRLLALGFRPGKLVQMIRKAWLFGPLHLRIGTTEVMIRRQNAKFITVRKITEITT